MIFGIFGRFMDKFSRFSQMLAKFVKMQQRKSSRVDKCKNFYTTEI